MNWTYRFDYFLRIDCSGSTSHFIVSVSVVIASNYPGRNLKWMATHLTILITRVNQICILFWDTR